jgi:hypothetical protein
VTPDVLTCVVSISAERLSLWRDGGLPASEAQPMREHTADCPACRARLAGFEQVAQTLRRQRELEPDERVWSAVRQRAGRAPARLLRPSLGRALRGLAALAAVLVLAALFASVLGGHLGRGTIAGQATRTASPTATPPASTYPGRMEIADAAAAQQLSYAYVLANDVWIGQQGRQPLQATHLGLGTDHLIWTIAWAQDHTLLLANETSDVDATTARAWLIELAPALAVSEVAADSPLVRGCANYFSCQWVGHRFVVHVDRAIPRKQYHTYRIYDMKAGADVASPLDGQTIYTLEVRGALVYYSVPAAEFDFGRINVVDPTGAQPPASLVAPSVAWSGNSLWDLSADGMRVITWPMHGSSGVAACSTPSCVYSYASTGGAATNIFTQSRPPGGVVIAPDGGHAATLSSTADNKLQLVRQPLPTGAEVASAVPDASPGHVDALIGWSADSQLVFDRQEAEDGQGNTTSTRVFVAMAEGSAPATLVLTLHDGANLFIAPND